MKNVILAVLADGSRGGSTLIKVHITSYKVENVRDVFDEPTIADAIKEIPWAEIVADGNMFICDMSDTVYIAGENLFEVMQRLALLFKEGA